MNRKRLRQDKAAKYLETQLKTGHRNDSQGVRQSLTDHDKKRITRELETLKNPKKKKKKVVVSEQTGKKEDKYFIDIFSIKYGYVKQSERRKNKGKSKKKLKRVKQSTHLKTVVAQPGLLAKYRDGQMGLSPKYHSFRMRKDEPSYY